MAILTNLLYVVLGVVFGLLMNWYDQWQRRHHPPKKRASTSESSQWLRTGKAAVVKALAVLMCVWFGTVSTWGWPYLFGLASAFAYVERTRCVR